MWLNVMVNLDDAAQRLGVHYQTAYRWVRTGTLGAVKRGCVYDISEAEVERVLADRSVPQPPPRVGHVRTWAVPCGRLYDALLAGDEHGARVIVDRLCELRVEAVELIEELIAPVMRRVGEEWASERICVATEHRAAAICERLLARISMHPRGRPRGVAVVATAPGEQHSLPAGMAAVALRADRWHVHHLGTEVPVADLAALAAGVRADLVVFSLTYTLAKAEAEEAAERVGARGFRVLLGEPGRSLHSLLASAKERVPRPGLA